MDAATGVDPEAKEESEFAATYSDQAGAIEDAEFQRLAETLREIASMYEQESQRILNDSDP